MKKLKYLIVAVIMSAGLPAAAQSPEEVITDFFWQSPEVVKRVNYLTENGYVEKRGSTAVLPKHSYNGPYGSVERSYLVAQVFANNRMYPRSTSLVGVVSLNAFGKPIKAQIVELPKGGANDFVGAPDEN